MKIFTIKQIGVITALTLGVILAFSPVENRAIDQIDFEELAANINGRNDHVTAEQVGQLLIDKDPDLQIIDLRDPAEYEKFHIQTAINIPLEKLFSPEQLEFIDPDKLVVLYTNGGTHAAQAWVMLQQMGYTNTTVLLGGLNYWVDVYTNPTPPEGVYADSEIFNYQFQVSAGGYLMGNMEAKSTTQDAPEPVKIKIPKRRKKPKAADEGC
jgi:rhodanese-related sulfurtransferase